MTRRQRLVACAAAIAVGACVCPFELAWASEPMMPRDGLPVDVEELATLQAWERASETQDAAPLKRGARGRLLENVGGGLELSVSPVLKKFLDDSAVAGSRPGLRRAPAQLRPSLETTTRLRFVTPSSLGGDPTGDDEENHEP